MRVEPIEPVLWLAVVVVIPLLILASAPLEVAFYVLFFLGSGISICLDQRRNPWNRPPGK